VEDKGRKRSRDPKGRKVRNRASYPRGCRRDGGSGGTPKFELITASVMSAAVRARLRKLDPRASKCEGQGSDSCQRNRAEETECENGVCSNREVQRGCFVPTEGCWYGDKGWGLRVTRDACKDDIVEQYVGEVLEPDDFWERFTNTSGDEPMYFCEFVHGLIIDAKLKG